MIQFFKNRSISQGHALKVREAPNLAVIAFAGTRRANCASHCNRTDRAKKGQETNIARLLLGGQGWALCDNVPIFQCQSTKQIAQ